MKDFTILEIKPNIFFVDFKDHYNMCMTFLRYQEFYESPNKKFRGKQFTIVDFMEWYSPKYGKGAFTYPIDWGGFNIPGNLILNLQYKVGILDWNKYDTVMSEIYNTCAKKINPSYKESDCSPYKFYVIAAVGEKDCLQHEIAHGLFYTVPSYKKKMTALVKELKPEFREAIFKRLEELGYTEKVYVDEAQAYLATGLENLFTFPIADERNPFIQLFGAPYER